MNNIRCDNCSFLNFASAQACKRCGSPLASADASAWEQPQGYTQASGYNSQPYAPYQNYYSLSTPSRGKRGWVVVLALLCLVAIIGVPWYLKSSKSGGAASLAWKDYTADDGSFSIAMPGEVKRHTETRVTGAGAIQMHAVGVDMGKQAAFMVMYADYSPAITDVPSDKLYDAAMQSLTMRGDILVMGRKDITLNGRPGIELIIRSSAGANFEGSGVCRVFIVSTRAYVVIAVGSDTEDFVAAKTKFLDSFKVLKSY